MKFLQYLKEAEAKKTPKEKIVELFTSESKISESDVEKLLKEIKIDRTEFDSIVYNLLTSFFNKGRYNKSNKKHKFDKKELEMGLAVEMEHTNDPIIAEKIAKDHLTEKPGTGNNDGYYSLLERMEAGVFDKD